MALLCVFYILLNSLIYEKLTDCNMHYLAIKHWTKSKSLFFSLFIFIFFQITFYSDLLSPVSGHSFRYAGETYISENTRTRLEYQDSDRSKLKRGIMDSSIIWAPQGCHDVTPGVGFKKKTEEWIPCSQAKQTQV